MLAEFGSGQFFWSMLWFTLFVIWIWAVIIIFSDIMRSDDLSGWGKALWTFFIIFMPYLGMFVYLIARGGGMSKRAVRQAQAEEQQFRAYVNDVTAAGGGGTADELARLADLHNQGTLTDAEYAQAKAKALG